MSRRPSESRDGDPLEVLLEMYGHDAATLRGYGDERAAALLERIVADVRRVRAEMESDLVSLQEAEATTGYSADHIRRLAREEKLHPVRRGRRLFFRRGELPRKPSARVDAPRMSDYDANADASRVAGGRRRGDPPDAHTAA